MYLICRETAAVFKKRNVKRYFETKRCEYANFNKDVMKKSKIAAFKSQLKSQKAMFKKFRIKRSKPFDEVLEISDTVNFCLIVVDEL